MKIGVLMAVSVIAMLAIPLVTADSPGYADDQIPKNAVTYVDGEIVCQDSDLGSEDYAHAGRCVSPTRVITDMCYGNFLVEASCDPDSARCVSEKIDCTFYGYDRCYHGECINNANITGAAVFMNKLIGFSVFLQGWTPTGMIISLI